jgi:CAAX protease family protein
MALKTSHFEGRAALDIVLLLAFGFGVAAYIPGLLVLALGGENVAVTTVVAQGSIILVIWALLRWRGYGISHIGLGRPARLRNIFLAGGGVAAALLAVSFATETLGLTRDLSNFNFLKGSLADAIFAAIFYGILSAGFYEEILYRGYLMHRFADIFSRSKTGWALAICFQALIFGLSHLHQGLYGALYTGVLSVLLGAYYVWGIRSLWVLVVGHGLYDALRMLYFYYALTYGGLESLSG